MRRFMMGALVAALSLSGTVGMANAKERLSIAPSSGHQSETFTVSGTGLQPGLALDINFKSPGGTVFSTAALNKVVVVGPDGKFAFDFIPANSFAGEDAGEWDVQVCVTQTDDCAEGDFEIHA
ncbi:MAG: hypothetical protein U0821_19700 [Chloroflexota bacterium]